MPDELDRDSARATTGSMVLVDALLFLSAAETLGFLIHYLYGYQAAGWWSQPALGGVIILAGLLAVAVICGCLGYQAHTHRESTRALLKRVVAGRTLILILTSLGLALMAILLIILKPEALSNTSFQALQKHRGLPYLALALVLQASWFLASLKFMGFAASALRVLRRYRQMNWKPIADHLVLKTVAFGRWLKRKEFISTTVIFLVLILLFFAPTLLQGKLPLSTSYLYQQSPWASYRGQFKNDMVVNYVLSDDYDAGIPVMKFIYTEIQNGRFPLWNPYQNGGVPVGTLLWSRIFALQGLAVAFAGVQWGTLLYACLKIYVAGICMYYYLRYRGLSRAAALLGGLVLMFSAHVITNGMSDVTDAIIYAPAILYFADRFIQERKYWQFLCLVVSVSVTLLSGFPSVIMYTLLLVVFYLAYRNLIELPKVSFPQRLRNLAMILLAFSIGVLLLAFTLVPTYEFFKTINISYRIGRGSATLAEDNIGILVNSNICGNPVQSDYVCSGNYNESAMYVGLFPLMLIPFSLAGKRYRSTSFFFLAAAVLVLMIVFGVASLNVIVGSLPLFNGNPNTRMIALLPLCFAFISGAGIEGLTGTTGKRGYWVLVLYLLLGIFILWAFERMSLVFAARMLPAAYPLTQRLVTMLLLLFYSLAVVGLLALRRRTFVSATLTLMLIANFAERCLLLAGYQGASYPGTFYPQTPGISFLETQMPKYERMLSIYRGLIPSFPLYFSINALVGHEFADTAFKANLELISPGIYAGNTTQPIIPPSAIDLGSPLLDAYRVRHIVLSPGGDPIWLVALANQSEYNGSYPLGDLEAFGQSITSTRDGRMDFLEVMVQTPGHEPIPVGVRILSGKSVLADFTGRLVQKDNGWYSIDLPSLPVRKGQQIAFDITPIKEFTPPDSHVYFVDYDRYAGGAIMLNGEENTVRGDLAFSMLEYDATLASKYKLVHTGDLEIYENTSLSQGIPVVTELRYSSQVSCASALSLIDPSREAIVEDKSISLAGDGAVLEPPSANTAGDSTDASARIREYDASSVVIDAYARQTSMVVLSDTYYPGWRATVDGKETEIYRADCDMRGVIIAPGRHVIRMSYLPDSLRIGLGISLFIVAGLVFVGVTNSRGPRRKVASDMPGQI